MTNTILKSVHGNELGIDENGALVAPSGVDTTFVRATDRVVNVTASTLAVTAEAHAGRIVTLSRAAGQAVTLPSATGSGAVYEFEVADAITSNSTTIKVAAGTAQIMRGICVGAVGSADGGSFFATNATTDTITLDGGDNGGLAGTRVRLVDVEAGVWNVFVANIASGTEVTPFSATVTAA